MRPRRPPSIGPRQDLRSLCNSCFPPGTCEYKPVLHRRYNRRHSSAAEDRVSLPPMSEAPARHLNLTGASNFRDLGGYPGKDGRLVRWRQIFRPNHIGHLTDADFAAVRALAVTSPLDFRGLGGRAERISVMNAFPVHSLPV